MEEPNLPLPEFDFDNLSFPIGEVSLTYDSPLCQMSAQQNMHWTAGIVRRFKHFPVVKFILSLWHSLASRQ
jgi:hypothetical protein